MGLFLSSFLSALSLFTDLINLFFIRESNQNNVPTVLGAQDVEKVLLRSNII